MTNVIIVPNRRKIEQQRKAKEQKRWRKSNENLENAAVNYDNWIDPTYQKVARLGSIKGVRRG